MVRFNKIKYLSHFVIILLFTIQVIPRQELNAFYNKDIPDTNISLEITVLNTINFQYQQVLNKTLQHLNFSYVSIINDKFDVTAEKISTDSREIYGGSFSYLNRCSTFLTALFATST